MRTFQTRPEIASDDLAHLDAYAELFGHALRSLHAMRAAEKPISKPAFMTQFGLTSRQYNAVKISLDGMYDSVKERLPGLIEEDVHRLKSTKKRLKKAFKSDNPFVAHHLKRRIFLIETRLAARREDLHRCFPALCFGSRKLFNAQHDLKANGYKKHAEWLQDWHDARSSQFFVLGSKDETGGNQGCTLTHLAGNRFHVRLRLPNSASRPHVLFEVEFAYGANVLRDALDSGRAISYRFKRDGKGWRLFASTLPIEFKRISDISSGSLGLDLNADHVALSHMKHDGNLLETWRIPLVTYGLSSNQAKDAISLAVKEIIGIAMRLGSPLIVERLDFSKKKASLKEFGARYSRMLSGFSYAAFYRLLRARAHDAGIAVFDVNPAYTSVIGKRKFSSRYGLSVHQGAALAIARRHSRFSERPNRRDQSSASPGPGRIRGEHAWSFWRRVVREKAGVAPRDASSRVRGAPARSSPRKQLRSRARAAIPLLPGCIEPAKSCDVVSSPEGVLGLASLQNRSEDAMRSVRIA